ncbi:MAG: NAD(P)-dependent glycerol-3-phosphate dehydrogenase [Chitinophagales bacterium]|nr:NAD(P)-dependent glycerol-3-phosphate dehydrogenase [Chitinophagales bacterium]
MIGVIGAGSFGSAVANLLAENGAVLIHSKRQEAVDEINQQHTNKGLLMNPNIAATTSLEEIANATNILFPAMSSDIFRVTIKQLAPFLSPEHIIIHCTKGFDIKLNEDESLTDANLQIKLENVKTMSQVILEETCVKRVGCMSGPNLARELAQFHPAATVIASKFNEVIISGRNAIRSHRLLVYGNKDIYAVELAGVLKNTMAIAAGALHGLGYGQNALAFLITRGNGEIIKLATKMGANPTSFLGLAGIGDLVATCSSPLSRNFSYGYKLSQGKTRDEILSEMNEVAEGVKTVNICYQLSKQLKVDTPIINAVYSVVYENVRVEDALNTLMQQQFSDDVDFLYD